VHERVICVDITALSTVISDEYMMMTMMMFFFFGALQGRLRAGSMPPPSLRASSQPPGARSGSAAPPELSGSSVIHHVTHVARPVSPGGVIKHRSPTTTVVRGVRGDGTTGVISAVPRSSHAAARRRSSISVIPGTTATATWRATNNHQPIVRIHASTCL